MRKVKTEKSVKIANRTISSVCVYFVENETSKNNRHTLLERITSQKQSEKTFMSGFLKEGNMAAGNVLGTKLEKLIKFVGIV